MRNRWLDETDEGRVFAGVGVRQLHLSYSHAACVWLDMEPALIHTWKCDMAVLTPSIAMAPLPRLGVKDLTHSGLLISEAPTQLEQAWGDLMRRLVIQISGKLKILTKCRVYSSMSLDVYGPNPVKTKPNQQKNKQQPNKDDSSSSGDVYTRL